MDKTTLGGFAAGWGLVALAIVLGGVGFGPYIDIPSVLIVFGGTIAVTAGQFEGKDLKRFSPAMKVAFNPTKVETLEDTIEKIIYYATEIKKHGVMQIEQQVMQEDNPFFKEAFSLLVDGAKPDLLEPLLETKMEWTENRHKTMIAIFGSAGGTAGAMGMIGTLVGLVAMLANLSDPSAVGPAMAVALLTTMYGALFGTLFAGIIESKLSQKHEVEMQIYGVIMQGASMIAAEESIGNIKMKLQAMLVPESD
jgi:chemotaxis protein MotA